MYLKSQGENPVKIIEQSRQNKRWKLIVSFSEGQFQQVSFVNSICTTRGGTHVNSVTDRICSSIIAEVKKKHKKLNLKIKNFQIKQ